MVFVKMRFERPKDIMKDFGPVEIGGEQFKLNPEAFQRQQEKEYMSRLVFLDLALSMEGEIDEIIVRPITKDVIKSDFVEETLLSKISFEQKINIFRQLLKQPFPGSERVFNIRVLKNNEIIVGDYKIRINRFLGVIRLVKEVRNHAVHKHRVFIAYDKIMLHGSDRQASQEYDKEEVLIKGHFCLWIINLMKTNSWINEESLKAYFEKYKEILSSIASLDTR